MEKMRLETKNITDENIKKILELFPNVVTEAEDENGNLKRAIDFDKLKQELSDDVVEGEEKYDFTWVGKKEAMIEANRPIRKTLRPCRDKSLNWEDTENIYIEGDNLDALKLLQESYLGKIKMIYIDPPYNTGKDFVYRDNFHKTDDENNQDINYKNDENEINVKKANEFFQNTESNGRFHSDWCSMIYSRLKLARNLLSDDGVIFISIDDNEVRNLKNICDEVFGEENCLPIYNRVTKKSSDSGNNFAPCIDYILSYAKNINNIIEFKIGLSEEIKARYNKVDEYENIRGKYQEVGLFQSALKHGGSSYFIKCPDGQEVIPPNNQPWRWNETTFKQGLIENRIVFKQTSNSPLLTKTNSQANWNVYTKVYLKERELKGTHPKNFSDSFQNTLATNELRKLGIPFDFAKPTNLIAFLSKLLTQNNDIILDFFSGSATTAHACMQLNAEDGGNRKFIMVQIPQTCDEKSEAFKAGYKNICEIGEERIRRAGQQILNQVQNDGKKIDVGFRVFKVDDTNMKEVYYSPNETDQKQLGLYESNIKDDRTDEDLLYGCLLDWGIELSLPHRVENIDGKKVHIVNQDDLVACFEENIPESVIRKIAEMKPTRVVFRDSSFNSDDNKINVEEIFKLITPDTRVKVI